ncbi:MAG TPA: HAMP domain-containing sensor histidine kinase [Acidimicrobiales bacterium]|nr:HAMP domain-containing sensor histidine kinase [Acidimicrobiales bacterium]
MSRLGLRARVTAAFAVGAFALSAVLAGITYFTARQSFLNERQTAIQRQAYVNALLVRNSLQASGTQVNQLVDLIDTLPGSVVNWKGQWYATSISVGQSAIPAQEQALVLGGTPATQRFSLDGSVQVVVGVPLPAVHSAYFDVVSLQELAGTLRALAFALGAAALVTTVAGAAVGRWASGRALRPLVGITDAAVAIAGGQLDTRVEAGEDADLQKLASAFNRMAGNLQSRIEREARFTSDVSHELRSPLTTLSASIGVLEGHREELDPRAQRALSLLDGDLQRFKRMVDDLLEISRFDAGSAELSLDEVDPGELVRQAVMATSPIGEDGNRIEPVFPVEVAFGVDGLRLRVDKRRFERVMANLVDNATDYAGGVTRVIVDREPPGAGPDARSIRVIVEDHGPGVQPPDRAHLFERFYRGTRSGQRASGEGTGLGLSLVTEHVHLHGGTVSIEDAEGGGARFIVELPLTQPETDGSEVLL